VCAGQRDLEAAGKEVGRASAVQTAKRNERPIGSTGRSSSPSITIALAVAMP
jgi:hypothetical protein